MNVELCLHLTDWPLQPRLPAQLRVVGVEPEVSPTMRPQVSSEAYAYLRDPGSVGSPVLGPSTSANGPGLPQAALPRDHSFIMIPHSDTFKWQIVRQVLITVSISERLKDNLILNLRTVNQLSFILLLISEFSLRTPVFCAVPEDPILRNPGPAQGPEGAASDPARVSSWAVRKKLPVLGTVSVRGLCTLVSYDMKNCVSPCLRA